MYRALYMILCIYDVDLTGALGFLMVKRMAASSPLGNANYINRL
jgi:hypothetical protein